MLIAQGAMIIMTLYLLYEAHSATAMACFFLAGIPMVLTYSFWWARQRGVVQLLVFSMVAVSFSALFLDIGSGMVEELGRDSTLTGRTNVWRSAFGLVRNPILGTGFESFWVGPRLKAMERLIDQSVNQAHDGYIEVYLNLGWVGVTLLAVILLFAYRRIIRDVPSMSQAASLRLGFLIVALTYNFTEAGFKMMHPVWLTLLVAAMVIPEIPVSPEPPRLGLDLPSLGRKPETPRYAVPVGRYVERR
jgi:O-antigen ligase